MVLELELPLVTERGLAKSAVVLNSCLNLLLLQKSNRGMHAYLEAISVFQLSCSTVLFSCQA